MEFDRRIIPVKQDNGAKDRLIRVADRLVVSLRNQTTGKDGSARSLLSNVILRSWSETDEASLRFFAASSSSVEKD